mmetsp:Transcript_54242/g.110323  ORF Transcript_54242/g.110323 Transcript_54242/m.110323 type:complete len:206 (-) Transcript_54242:1889-2506(-)
MPSLSTLTGTRTSAPGRPLAPLAVHTTVLMACLCVAWLDLRRWQRLAGLAAWLRGLDHIPFASRLPTITRLRAGSPLGPGVPKTILAVASRCKARLNHGEVQITSLTTFARFLFEIPRSGPVANATSGTAATPSCPFSDNAIASSAWFQGAALCFNEHFRTCFSAIHWVLRNLSVSHLLTTSTCLVASIPLRPFRGLAVHFRHAA